jgi:hypothetical protein
MAPDVGPSVDRVQVDEEISLRREVYEPETAIDFLSSSRRRLRSFSQLSVQDPEERPCQNEAEEYAGEHMSSFSTENFNFLVGRPGGVGNLPKGGRGDDLPESDGVSVRQGGGVPTRYGGRLPTEDVMPASKSTPDSDHKNRYSEAVPRQFINYSDESRSISRAPTLKLGSYDGSTCLLTILAKFVNCCDYCGWSEKEKLCYLQASLEGPAGQVLWGAGRQGTVKDLWRFLKNTLER